MTDNQQLVVFQLDHQQYAVYLSAVERVFPAVEITPLPDAPDIVSGIVNIHGHIVPAISIRRRLGQVDRALELNDRLLVVRSPARTLALIVDAVEGVRETPRIDLVRTGTLFPGLGLVEGVMRLEDGLVLIFDLDGFLSPLHEKALAQALQHREEQPAAEARES